ncbi:MAG TPA: hypothetical protein VNW54_08730 [Granulicella sp.]|nr:hypothetical protein [Granulicella sp.]
MIDPTNLPIAGVEIAEKRVDESQRLHEEVLADYNDMIYAASAAEIEARVDQLPEVSPGGWGNP